MLRIASLLAALAATTLAAVPVQWRQKERSAANEIVQFSVAMPQRNLDELDRIFWAVSEPGSSEYGKHRSFEELNKLTATDPAIVRDVLAWLESSNDVSCKVFSDSLRCRASTGAIEQLLSTEFHAYEDPVTGDVIHRARGDFAFPSHMHGKIEFITGLSSFPVPRYGRVASSDSSSDDTDYYVVPETLTKFYNLGSESSSSQVVQAAVEFQGYGGYVESDLQTFIKNTGIDSFSIDKKVGPYNPSPGAAESALDVQYLGAVGTGATNWYITEEQWLFDFTQNVLSGSIPQADVLSMSYGWSEAQQCQIAPNSKPCSSGGGSTAYVTRTNTDFQKIGAAGTTLLAASGDAGAHGRSDGFCSSAKLNPAFPASSPYLTAVGATQIKNGESQGASSPICQSQLQCATGGDEVVASSGTGALITSGGGFSNVAPMPDYQKDVVQAYLKKSGVAPPTSDFNSSGRGYPDVAALGHKYYLQLGGQSTAVDGTSASCPVFAGVISLLNGYRLSQGKSKIGFANPLIYKIGANHPDAFNSVTTGNNKCTEYQCCSTGFSATQGWDATTGFGTPNYPNLKSAVVQMDLLYGI